MVYHESANLQIVTPYDSMIPIVEERSAQFYLDAIRIYLGICSGTVTMENATKAVSLLKANPEFAKSPFDPTVLPLSEIVKNRLIDNLKTLTKYNLHTLDSIKSAYTFAFLQDDSPIQQADLRILRYVSKNPLASLATTSKELGNASKTISKSLQKLAERNGIRFSCLVDTSAFGVDSYILFFRLNDRSDRDRIEEGLAEFPFTKNILTTAMSEFGYAALLFPSTEEGYRVLRDSVRKLTGPVFRSTTLHEQKALGAATNLNLYDGLKWAYPEALSERLKDAARTTDSSRGPLLRCQGPTKGLVKVDFAIAAQLKLSSREPPSLIAHRLRLKGFEVESKQVSESLQKMKAMGLLLPYLMLGGMGLNANFCFEILCTSEIADRILAAVPETPQSTYYVSSNGVIIWINVPSVNQVEYYQAFRALEQIDHVTAVNPIMTITRVGSRSMLDLTKNWSFGPRGWYVDPDKLDLTQYLE